MWWALGLGFLFILMMFLSTPENDFLGVLVCKLLTFKSAEIVREAKKQGPDPCGWWCWSLPAW